MWLFLDMNSYFAACEQQRHEELRGRPVGVAPVVAETTCCIAVSSEARSSGVKTGTRVSEARRLCPNITILEADPTYYRKMHNRIVDAVETLVPVHEVLSIDEMTIKPWRNEVSLADSLRLGQRLQETISRDAGDWMTCSIGIAPNAFLAKVASDLHKPRGLSVIDKSDLPHKLLRLKLTDWPGISTAMERRFNEAGVHTTGDMYELPMPGMRRVFGGINGERWWKLIRGEDVHQLPTRRSQIGHSSVLSPEYRNPAGAWAVACRQVEKAAERLRSESFYAGSLSISVSSFKEEGWSRSIRFSPTNQTALFLQSLKLMWQSHVKVPSKVSAVLHELVEEKHVTPDMLYDERGTALDQAADHINRKHGRGTLTVGASLPAKEYLNHERISFGMIAGNPLQPQTNYHK